MNLPMVVFSIVMGAYALATLYVVIKSLQK